jgi:hypothetical protein
MEPQSVIPAHRMDSVIASQIVARRTHRVFSITKNRQRSLSALAAHRSQPAALKPDAKAESPSIMSPRGVPARRDSCRK